MWLSVLGTHRPWSRPFSGKTGGAVWTGDDIGVGSPPWGPDGSGGGARGWKKVPVRLRREQSRISDAARGPGVDSIGMRDIGPATFPAEVVLDYVGDLVLVVCFLVLDSHRTNRASTWLALTEERVRKPGQLLIPCWPLSSLSHGAASLVEEVGLAAAKNRCENNDRRWRQNFFITLASAERISTAQSLCCSLSQTILLPPPTTTAPKSPPPCNSNSGVLNPFFPAGFGIRLDQCVGWYSSAVGSAADLGRQIIDVRHCAQMHGPPGRPIENVGGRSGSRLGTCWKIFYDIVPSVFLQMLTGPCLFRYSFLPCFPL